MNYQRHLEKFIKKLSNFIKKKRDEIELIIPPPIYSGMLWKLSTIL